MENGVIGVLGELAQSPVEEVFRPRLDSATTLHRPMADLTVQDCRRMYNPATLKHVL